MSKTQSHSTNGGHVYAGHQFDKLPGKVRFATFNGEIVQITLINGFSEEDLPDLCGFIRMWMENDYIRVFVEVENSADCDDSLTARLDHLELIAA